MSELIRTKILGSSISTPSTGVVTEYVDTADNIVKSKDDTGYVRSYKTNYSTTSQSPTAATRTYIAGSNFIVGSQKLQAGSLFRWRFNLTKTAAGIATSTFDIAFGTSGSTADTARVSFTKPAGTAVADEGWIEITCTIRSIGASGVPVGEFIMSHNGNTAGHATIPIVVVNTIGAGFDTTTVTNVGVCITSGSGDVVTIQQVISEAWNI